MQEEDLKLHIVQVNDEVIDLRNKIFDKEYIPVPPVNSMPEVPRFCTKLYGSEPVLQKAKFKRRIPITRELQKPRINTFGIRFQDSLAQKLKAENTYILENTTSEGLKKLAETLYNGPVSFASVSSATATASKQQPPPNIIRNKPILRSKIPNNRLHTIDPRFRRARSPSSKNHTMTTQSESRVSPTNSERKKAKSRSDSKFLLNSQESDPVSNPRAQIGEPQGDSSPSTRNLLTQKSGYTDTRVGHIGEAPSTKSNDKDKTNEDPTITDSTSFRGVSLYQSAVCGDFVVPKETEVCAPVKLIKLYDHSAKPFWDDPRLLDKYGKFLKPVSIAPRNSLSSWTLPVQKSSKRHNDSISGDYKRSSTKSRSQKRLYKSTCAKCVCTFDKETTCSGQSSRSISPNESHKSKLYSLILTNYILALFFTVGSICGLMLLGLVIWIVANDLMWPYFQNNTTPRFTGLSAWVAYFCGGVIYGILFVIKTVGYLFIMPRNEVYESATKVDTTESWYASLISWW